MQKTNMFKCCHCTDSFLSLCLLHRHLLAFKDVRKYVVDVEKCEVTILELFSNLKDRVKVHESDIADERPLFIVEDECTEDGAERKSEVCCEHLQTKDEETYSVTVNSKSSSLYGNSRPAVYNTDTHVTFASDDDIGDPNDTRNASGKYNAVKSVYFYKM